MIQQLEWGGLETSHTFSRLLPLGIGRTDLKDRLRHRARRRLPCQLFAFASTFKNASRDTGALARSILRHRGIYLVRPGQDSALQIEDFAEAGFAQEIDGFGGTLATAAMRDDLARGIEFVHPPRYLA
jgi:hypothetical protein